MSKPFRPSYFTVEERGEVTFVRFTHHQELVGTDLSRIRELWLFLDAQKSRPSKVLVLLAPTGVLNPENLHTYWRELLTPPETSTAAPALSETTRLNLMREENASCQFIQGVRAIGAFVIVVLQGKIDLSFLGPVLACDYRIVADDVVFVGRCLDLGLPTCAGLPWFLPRFLGHGKAAELLLSGREITAGEALELSLVNEVVPLIELEQRMLETAERFASRPRPGLVALKRSMVAAERPLADYLREERHLFECCIHVGEGLREEPQGAGKRVMDPALFRRSLDMGHRRAV